MIQNVSCDSHKILKKRIHSFFFKLEDWSVWSHPVDLSIASFVLMEFNLNLDTWTPFESSCTFCTRPAQTYAVRRIVDTGKCSWSNGAVFLAADLCLMKPSYQMTNEPLLRIARNSIHVDVDITRRRRLEWFDCTREQLYIPCNVDNRVADKGKSKQELTTTVTSYATMVRYIAIISMWEYRFHNLSWRYPRKIP